MRDSADAEDHEALREGVRAVVSRFDDDYWFARDDDGLFPFEFHKAMAQAGWLGITMPEEYGGAGLGVTEAAIMMREVASHGGGMAAASSVHINLFGPHAIVVHGTERQKATSWSGKRCQGGRLVMGWEASEGSCQTRLHQGSCPVWPCDFIQSATP